MVIGWEIWNDRVHCIRKCLKPLFTLGRKGGIWSHIRLWIGISVGEDHSPPPYCVCQSRPLDQQWLLLPIHKAPKCLCTHTHTHTNTHTHTHTNIQLGIWWRAYSICLSCRRFMFKIWWCQVMFGHPFWFTHSKVQEESIWELKKIIVS